MKKEMLLGALLAAALAAPAMEKTVKSPDGNLVVTVNDEGGNLTYAVSLGGKQMLLPSRLGLRTNFGDLTSGLTIKDSKDYPIEKHYDMTRTKFAHIDFKANASDIQVETAKGLKMTVTFVVDNNDVAFRYTIPRQKNDNPKCAIIESEASSFLFPSETTTFICPQITPMTGWERTKPSYEEEYRADAPMTDKSQYGVGYTFPCLFHVGDKGWALVSETGVDGQYCASRLSDFDAQTGYTVSYPQQGENNGFGSNTASIMLPGSTPWRTIALGQTLKPIAETTIQYSVVEPKYEATEINYHPGRYTWSWIIWQDNSCNYDDQKTFIDLANKYGYEYILVDALWDKQIGREGMEKLAAYAKQKNVKLMVWYNSNGSENDAPQGPRGIMNNSIKRKQEMKWLHKLGVAAIKVDFFGGDKQETLRLYEDILSDANDYGIGVIFHGCTIPRGWERMYPNYIGSEGALASENVFFTDHHARQEGFEMTMHPFSRNAIGSFDWGGVLMNDYMSKDNHSRHPRYTSRLFELATAITNQCSINCVAITPQADSVINNVERDFLLHIPTSWKDTRFLDGYPTKYVVMARLDAASGKWLVGGINGVQKPIVTSITMKELAGKTVTLLYESKDRQTMSKSVKVSKDGKMKLAIPAMGGVVIKE